MPSPGLDRIAKPPDPCFPRVGTCTNKRPTLARCQLDDAVNLHGVDVLGLTWNSVNELAVPTAVWIQVDHLFDIAAIDDFGVETPGVIMRRGVRLFHLEPVQRASVIQIVSGERPQHSLDADDPRAFGNASNGCSR